MIKTDAPIIDPGGDKLGRAAFAEKLARYIEDLPPKPTTVIGLHGPWGSGKTSLLNMTKNMIDSDGLEVVWFNPWNQIYETSIIEELFNQIKEAFTVQLDGALQVRIAKAIDEYVDVVAGAAQAASIAMGMPIPKNVMKTPALSVSRRIRARGDKKLGSMAALKESVSNALCESNKRVLIIIDDIDRLPDEKICLVFQMVAAIANFPQVHYLLSFDWAVAARALDTIQAGYGEAYLEKIVQAPLRVPEVSRESIAKMLEGGVIGMIAGEPGNAIALAQYADRAHAAVREHVLPFAATLRDAKRYLNVLDFELKCSSDAIDPVDIACLASLKTFVPSAFRWVLHNQGLLLGTVPDDLYYLSETSVERHDEVCAEIAKSCSIDGAQAGRVLRLLASIFLAFGRGVRLCSDDADQAVLRAKRRIADVGLFELYQSGLLETDSFPSDEIREAAYQLSVPDLTGEFSEQFAMKSDTLAFGLCGYLDELPDSRAESVLAVLMGALGSLAEDHAVEEGTWSLKLLERCVVRIGKAPAATAAILGGLIDCGLDGLLVFAHWLYGQCIAFGDFGNGGASERGQLLEEKGFRGIVSYYVEALARNTVGVNVFERRHPRTAMIIWMRYDEDGCREYLDGLFEDPYNAMTCLMLSATPSSFDGPIPFWRIDWQFKRFMTPVEAGKLLSEFVASPRFREIDRESQQALAAMGLALAEYEYKEVETDVIKHDLVEGKLADWDDEYRARSSS